MRCAAIYSIAIAMALAALGAGAQAATAGFPVLEGHTQAVIVYSHNARDEAVQAYQDLAAYLKKSTGHDFQVVSENDFQPQAGKFPIYVGQCRPVMDVLHRELWGMDRDAYLVVVEPTRVMLVGPRPWSTYWAVCQFLEDYAGVRWLIPGPLGEDVPHHDRLVAPLGHHLYSPAILSRLWSGANYGGVWSLRQRIHARYYFHHNLLHIFPAAKYYATHPEYFPLHGNKRYRPGPDDNSWQPCMGIEGTVQVAADAARAAFRANPDQESFSFGMNDGGGWCQCPKCKAIDHPLPSWHGYSGDKSVLYYTWLNKIAANLEKDYPHKLLGCLAYSAVELPPGFKLNHNIIPYLTSNRADYFDPSFRAEDEQLLSWWSQDASQMGIYDYAYGMGFAIPRIYNHLFQGAIKFAVAHKVKGFYAEVYPNWGLDGDKLYVMARLLWNPNVNVDALTNEWNDRMFREAAAPMKKYFALCEWAWRHQHTGHGAWNYRLAADPKQFQIFTPQIMDQCTAYLDQAAALAKEDIVKQRIHFFRKTWDVTLLLGRNYWAGRQVQELMQKNAPIAQVAAAMRQMAEKTSTVDIDKYVKEKVGDDPIAFYPPKAAWFAPLKAGAATNANRWAAAALANEAVQACRKAGTFNGAAIRRDIDARVTKAFGTGGSPQYQKIVALVRSMALKVGTAANVTQPPKIDGVLDDPVWQKADVLTNFIKWGESSPSDYVTKVRVAHDGSNLYVALECYQDTSKLVTDAAPRDGDTWKDDSVEIFINPGLTETPYVQFIINARGAFFDQWAKSDNESYAERLARNCNARWATKIYPDRWTAELMLPIKEFNIDIASHHLLRMDFVRNVHINGGRQMAISAWFPSIGAHADPMSRGWILFE